MAADHYFSSSPASDPELRTVTVTLAGAPRRLTTAAGVFSPGHVDAGTAVLLDGVPTPPESGNLLDVGCGWGPIALSLALASPGATVWAVDVNERALDLARRNAAALGLENVNAVKPEDVPASVRFAAVWSNPPIRVGKAELHGILTAWLPRLQLGAEAWLVVQRNLGSDSLQRWLEGTLGTAYAVDRASSSKGFRLLRVRRDV